MKKHFTISRHGKTIARATVEAIDDDNGETVTYFLYDVYVVPKRRGEGYATRLLHTVTQWADRQKVEVWLTAESQEKGIMIKGLKRLYKAAGWLVAWKIHDQAIHMKRSPR